MALGDELGPYDKRNGFMILRLVVSLSVFLCVQMVFLTRGNAMANEKINICKYGAKTIKALELKLHNTVVLQNKTDLAAVFENTPYKLYRTKKVNPRLHKLTGIPLGKVHTVNFRCPVSEVNTNKWLLVSLEAETGEVTQLDVYLFYEDEDFSKRGEALAARRFSSSIELANVINQIGQIRPKTREAFRDEMLAGGFLFHRSCQGKGVVSDIYVTPPVPPTSISALRGTYFVPIMRPNVAVTFSSENGEFLYAKRGVVSKGLYDEQTEDWLKTHYPNSWISQLFERHGHQ